MWYLLHALTHKREWQTLLETQEIILWVVMANHLREAVVHLGLRDLEGFPWRDSLIDRLD